MMTQVQPTEAVETLEASGPGKGPQALTLEILIARMMQTRRDIDAYDRGEMTKEEFDAIGIKLF